jgi:hypothetical protein
MKHTDSSEISELQSTGSTDPSLDDWEPETDHDDSLIHWMLGMSPENRLAALQDFADGVTELQRNARKITQ